jgi:hypothetical protein
VDTQLLEARVFEPNTLFQFMGEVVYCHPIIGTVTTSATSMTTKSDRSNMWEQGGDGHWVLQARTARLMDGLDLYSYRQAILLTRQLVQQYQQRNKEQRLEKADEEKEEQKEQEDYSSVVKLD